MRTPLTEKIYEDVDEKMGELLRNIADKNSPFSVMGMQVRQAWTRFEWETMLLSQSVNPTTKEQKAKRARDLREASVNLMGHIMRYLVKDATEK